MANTKKTMKEMYEEILEVVTLDEHKDFIQGRIAQLNKKQGSSISKAKLEEREKIANNIMRVFEENPTGVFQTMEIAEEVKLSPQKIRPILGKLMDKGLVENFKDKRVSFFKLAEVDTDTDEVDAE